MAEALVITRGGLTKLVTAWSKPASWSGPTGDRPPGQLRDLLPAGITSDGDAPGDRRRADVAFSATSASRANELRETLDGSARRLSRRQLARNRTSPPGC